MTNDARDFLPFRIDTRFAYGSAAALLKICRARSSIRKDSADTARRGRRVRAGFDAIASAVRCPLSVSPVSL
ncbi:hypothetical protein, partial [Burkholderia multivorans]|uniref:hypothetical protein n=1 Tax=Burkholderia multivorans TaxID=87883 RepID=UPI00287055E2